MELNNDDVSYKQVTDTLKKLAHVNAPKDFETTLWRKINSSDYKSPYKQESWWEKFLIPQRLIPASALGLASIILFVLFNISAPQSENPLMSQPRLIKSTDKTVFTNTTGIQPEDINTHKSSEINQTKLVEKKQPRTEIQKSEDLAAVDNAESGSNEPGQLYTSSDNSQTRSGFRTTSYSASMQKSGFNFLQVRLTPSEREKVNRLRERIQAYFNQQDR